MNTKWLILIGVCLIPPSGIGVTSGGHPATAILSPSNPISNLLPDPNCDRVKNASVVTVYANRRGTLGSGSVVANLSDGTSLILTNNHVIEEMDESLHVQFLDGRNIPGKLVARRPADQGDMGVIQVQGVLPAVTFSSQPPQVNDPVIAIGSPYGKAGVTTKGNVVDVPQLSRSTPTEGDITHKAALKPGNSGGPLLNASCQFVGLNKAEYKKNQQEPDGSGISLATSVKVVLPVIQAIAQAGGKDPNPQMGEGGREGGRRRHRQGGGRRERGEGMLPGGEGGMMP